MTLKSCENSRFYIFRKPVGVHVFGRHPPKGWFHQHWIHFTGSNQMGYLLLSWALLFLSERLNFNGSINNQQWETLRIFQSDIFHCFSGSLKSIDGFWSLDAFLVVSDVADGRDRWVYFETHKLPWKHFSQSGLRTHATHTAGGLLLEFLSWEPLAI
jgi:hypothetical protein